MVLAAARVEPERELVQVVPHLGLADGARARPHQPALQPRGHPIHAPYLREGVFPGRNFRIFRMKGVSIRIWRLVDPAPTRCLILTGKLMLTDIAWMIYSNLMSGSAIVIPSLLTCGPSNPWPPGEGTTASKPEAQWKSPRYRSR